MTDLQRRMIDDCRDVGRSQEWTRPVQVQKHIFLKTNTASLLVSMASYASYALHNVI